MRIRVVCTRLDDEGEIGANLQERDQNLELVQEARARFGLERQNALLIDLVLFLPLHFLLLIIFLSWKRCKDD